MLVVMSGTNEARSPRTNPLNGFEETVKDFWVSRPRRPHSRRKVAGVAAALGDRYGIDPVVVRVALVAATVFGGFGVVFYLLGWLFFAEEGDEVSGFEAMLGRGRARMSRGAAALLTLLLIPASGWAFTGGGWFDGGGLIWFALLFAALYLLHRGRGQDNRPVPVVAFAASGSAASGTGAFTMSSDTSTSAKDAVPGWDPLAADPAGWDLPDPAAATPPPPPSGNYNDYQPQPRRPRSKIGAATFGIAVVVAGVGVALNLNGVDWFTLQHIVGATLAVLGVGLVAGAFVRGSRGLIGIAVLLSIAGMVLTTNTFNSLSIRGGVGDLDASPRTVAEVQPEYRHAAGDIMLDLSQIPQGTPYSTTVSNGAGDTKVIVPRDADVTYTCQNSVGDVDCFSRTTSGVGQSAITGLDTGDNGPGGQQITLHVTSGAGQVEVLRG
jgi:phage shock protein PspC (stress-responsive transcriptional regulator)